MTNVDFEALRALGLKETQLQQWLSLPAPGRLRRVSRVDRGMCSTVGSIAEAAAEGDAHERTRIAVAESIVVGDWVNVAPPADGAEATVDTVMERSGTLRRSAVAESGTAQGIAANLDTVLVVAAFGTTEKLTKRGVNPRRLERFLAAIAEGGAKGVVVLNKADLVVDADERARALSRRLGGAEVRVVSAHAESARQTLSDYLQPRATVAFVGMSGVGKSSLLNRLAGHERMAVSAVRERDTKGRHTTTRRELTVIEPGVLVIDTPGMRGLGVMAADGAEVGFDEVEALAAECRFADCTHRAEPGCAVRQAIEQGAVSSERLASFHDLREEAARQRSRADALAGAEEKRSQKRLSRAIRRSQRD